MHSVRLGESQRLPVVVTFSLFVGGQLWLDIRCPLKLFYHSSLQLVRGEKIQ